MLSILKINWSKKPEFLATVSFKAASSRLCIISTVYRVIFLFIKGGGGGGGAVA